MTSPPEPVLEIDEIQGNIVPGFNKDHVLLKGLTITKAEDAKKWISTIINNISTCRDVYNFNKSFSSIKKRINGEPKNVSATWMNIAFAYKGLRILLDNEFAAIDSMLDPSFRTGLIASSPSLGDPVDENHEGHPKNWNVGAPDISVGESRALPDVFLIIASDDPDQIIQENASLNQDIQPFGVVRCYDEIGHDLSYYGYEKLRGHEHFGFKDGISQPGLRGRNSERIDDFLTPRVVNDDMVNEDSVEYGVNGKPLVAPGEFILGYELQSPNHMRKMVPALPTHNLLKNGSYLVFRRLRQDVHLFNNFITTQASRLSSLKIEISDEKLKSLLVGRWPSGTPLALSPDKDDPTLGSNPALNNMFGYVDDPDGFKTPVISHIRKVNPRDLSTDIGSASKTLTKRILRRGIPFGPPYDNTKDGHERGLLFMSYQNNIQDKFEFLTRKWMGKSNAPTNASTISSNAHPSGYDMLVGSINTITSQDKELYSYLHFRTNGTPSEHKIETNNFGLHHWVLPTGGGYFFAPSIKMLKFITNQPIN